MSGLILILLIALIFVVIYQIGQVSELSAVIRKEEATNRVRNKWLAWSFLLMFPIMMIYIYYNHRYFDGKMLPISASEHGEKFDSMFVVTLWVTGIVFVLTQFLLFYFAWKYRASDNRPTFFFAHSNKLEMIWTVIPAVAMAVLVAIGLINWFKMTSIAPANSQVVEVVGKQFNWIMRYPGPDGKFGKRNYKLINDADNVLGLDWTDPASKDDIINASGELHIQKGQPVKLIIASRDVIHDVGLPHFRMKMDAVPGIPTTMWFTPTVSTEEMKGITNNPNFVYEISCDQMCGKGHYSMKGTVIVHDKGGMDSWLKEQKSYYAQNNESAAAPATATTEAANTTSVAPAPADTTKKK